MIQVWTHEVFTCICTCPENHPGLGLCHKPPLPTPDQELHGQWPDAPDTHTHTQGHENWRGPERTPAAASCPREWKWGIGSAAQLYLIKLKKKWEWKWLPPFTGRKKTASHLVHLVPLGRVGVVHVFGGEVLRADPCYGIRVGQAGHHPFHIAVLSCQVLCLQQVDPHHSL